MLSSYQNGRFDGLIYWICFLFFFHYRWVDDNFYSLLILWKFPGLYVLKCIFFLLIFTYINSNLLMENAFFSVGWKFNLFPIIETLCEFRNQTRTKLNQFLSTTKESEWKIKVFIKWNVNFSLILFHQRSQLGCADVDVFINHLFAQHQSYIYTLLRRNRGKKENLWLIEIGNF